MLFDCKDDSTITKVSTMFSFQQHEAPMIKISKTFDLGSESDRTLESPSPEDAVTMVSGLSCRTPCMTPRKMNLSPSFMRKPHLQPNQTHHSMAFVPLIPECFLNKDMSMENGNKKIGFKLSPRFPAFEMDVLANDALPWNAVCFSPIDAAISSDEEEMEDINSTYSSCSSDDESDTVGSLPCLERIQLDQSARRRKLLPKKKSFSGKPSSPQRPPVRIPMIRRNSLGATAA